MTHNEMIKVIEHHKNGGEVEYKNFRSDVWADMLSTHLFNFEIFDYRIKEKPKTKTVYEIMFKHIMGSWYVGDKLLTESELLKCKDNDIFTNYQKTGRSWEVPND